jgi:hypothetical protein
LRNAAGSRRSAAWRMASAWSRMRSAACSSSPLTSDRLYRGAGSRL